MIFFSVSLSNYISFRVCKKINNSNKKIQRSKVTLYIVIVSITTDSTISNKASTAMITASTTTTVIYGTFIVTIIAFVFSANGLTLPDITINATITTDITAMTTSTVILLSCVASPLYLLIH